MTLSTRNTILRFGMAVSFLLAGAATSVTVWLYSSVFEDLASITAVTSTIATGTDVLWLGFRFPSDPDALLWIAGRAILTAWFAVIALALVARQFRRTTAPEMFFFSMFLLTLPMDAVRLLQVVHYFADLPIFLTIATTRLTYFAHAFGIFCLLGSSLYAVGVEYQRTGTAVSIAALIAFAFAYAVPVDPTVVYPNLLNPIGNQRTVQVVAIVLNVLVISNFLYARFSNDDRGYYVLVGAIVAVTTGNELLFYAAGALWAIVGTGLVLVGVIVFWRQLHALYLWIS